MPVVVWIAGNKSLYLSTTNLLSLAIQVSAGTTSTEFVFRKIRLRLDSSQEQTSCLQIFTQIFFVTNNLRKEAILAEEKRFEKWPPKIPKVGQTVQILIDNEYFETTVRLRAVSEDRQTFFIVVDWPDSIQGQLKLMISPNTAGHGRVDQAADRKPWWRIVPTPQRFEEKKSVKLFFLD